MVDGCFSFVHLFSLVSLKRENFAWMDLKKKSAASRIIHNDGKTSVCKEKPLWDGLDVRSITKIEKLNFWQKYDGQKDPKERFRK